MSECQVKDVKSSQVRCQGCKFQCQEVSMSQVSEKNKKILFLYKEFKDNIKLRRKFKVLNKIVIYATTF